MPTTSVMFSVDYELYFGISTGTVNRSMRTPTDALVEVLERHGARLSLFVDAGYLIRLRSASEHHPALVADYEAISSQLETLVRKGHDVQLHIHPHWEDCNFDGETWQLDISRYKLHDFLPEEQVRIVRSYRGILEDICGTRVFAYRAGGWCIQPFSTIRDALRQNDIWLDSTLFADGRSENDEHGFCFAGMPTLPHWCFSEDPLVPDPDGFFVELPISAYPLPPSFYWELLLRKKLAGLDHDSFGDGYVKSSNLKYYLTRLTRTVSSPVSLDGIKARVLSRAFSDHRSSGRGVFNVMGHPKSLTRYSLNCLDDFLGAHRDQMTFVTFQQFEHLKPTVRV